MNNPPPRMTQEDIEQLQRLTSVPPDATVVNADAETADIAASWTHFSQLLTKADEGLESPETLVSLAPISTPRRSPRSIAGLGRMVAACAAACLLLLSTAVAAVLYYQSPEANSDPAPLQPHVATQPVQKPVQSFIQNNRPLPDSASPVMPTAQAAWNDTLEQRLVAAHGNCHLELPPPQHADLDTQLQSLSDAVRFTSAAIRDGDL